MYRGEIGYILRSSDGGMTVTGWGSESRYSVELTRGPVRGVRAESS
jgi:hypothetical protein